LRKLFCFNVYCAWCTVAVVLHYRVRLKCDRPIFLFCATKVSTGLKLSALRKDDHTWANVDNTHEISAIAKDMEEC
jgi:hypothetical protein